MQNDITLPGSPGLWAGSFKIETWLDILAQTLRILSFTKFGESN
jgi:hypothetical protein